MPSAFSQVLTSRVATSVDVIRCVRTTQELSAAKARGLALSQQPHPDLSRVRACRCALLLARQRHRPKLVGVTARASLGVKRRPSGASAEHRTGPLPTIRTEPNARSCSVFAVVLGFRWQAYERVDVGRAIGTHATSATSISSPSTAPQDSDNKPASTLLTCFHNGFIVREICL